MYLNMFSHFVVIANVYRIDYNYRVVVMSSGDGNNKWIVRRKTQIDQPIL